MHAILNAVLPKNEISRRNIALGTILAAQLMLQMDFLIVMVALPRMQVDLGFTAANLSWIPNAFSLAFGGLLLLGGRIGDIVGRVRTLQAGITLFVVASLLGGLAASAYMLVGARVLQGIGAAIAAPSVLALVTTQARDSTERARGMALFITVSSIGASGGLILGGLLTEYLSWRWSLLINVPIGLLLVVLIPPLVKETSRQPGVFDVGGAVTATLGSIALVYGFIHAADSGWLTVGTLGAFVLASILGGLFFTIEGRARQPLLDLALLKRRARLVALGAMAIIVGMHVAMLFLVVQYLQRVLGYGPILAGLAYIPVTGTVFAVTHFMPVLLARFKARHLMVVGSAMTALSFIGFALIPLQGSYAVSLLGPMILHSLGIALVFTPGSVIAMEGVPDNQAGSASGLLQMDQQLGAALGVAVIVAIHAAAGSSNSVLAGLPVAFVAAAFISVLAALLAAFPSHIEKYGSAIRLPN